MKLHQEISHLVQKFKVAFDGIIVAYKKDNSIKLQFVLAIIALIFFAIIQIEWFDWIFVFLAIGLVVVSELFNTAIETICDTIEPHQDQKIKQIKDIAAGAVLFASFIALLIGLLLIIKYGGIL